MAATFSSRPDSFASAQENQCPAKPTASLGSVSSCQHMLLVDGWGDLAWTVGLRKPKLPPASQPSQPGTFLPNDFLTSHPRCLVWKSRWERGMIHPVHWAWATSCCDTFCLGLWRRRQGGMSHGGEKLTVNRKVPWLWWLTPLVPLTPLVAISESY